MSDRIDPGPYAPPDLSSYPQRLRREPLMEDDRRLSSWWWLLPITMFVASIALPTKELREGHIHLIADGRIAGFLGSAAVACTIGSINCFRQSWVATEESDILRGFVRMTLGFLGACAACFLFLYAAILFMPFVM